MIRIYIGEDFGMFYKDVFGNCMYFGLECGKILKLME